MSSEADMGVLGPTVESPDATENVERKVERLPAHQYCVFGAGRERYCLSVSEVEEVVEWSTLTRIPLAPPFLMGILNLRGVIIPVLDIAFKEGRRQDAEPTHIVVAIWGGETHQPTSGLVRVGFAADEMLGTYFSSEALLVEEAPSEVLHCRGMLRHGDRLALALSLDRLHEAFPVPLI
jgi:chemotaxis signal transduction protein